MTGKSRVRKCDQDSLTPPVLEQTKEDAELRIDKWISMQCVRVPRHRLSLLCHLISLTLAPPLKSRAAGIRGGSIQCPHHSKTSLKIPRRQTSGPLVRATAGLIVMAGKSLLRNKWWPVLENFLSPETAIVADSDIPSGTSSLPIVSCLNLKRFFTEKPVQVVLKAIVSSNGHLSVDRHMDWLPLMRMAENCEEQNVEAVLTPFTDAIVLRTCKDVRVGQELKVWLSHDLQSVLEIPFLLPSHILSHQLYRCSQCSDSFSQPNPLKIHMAFGCERKERTVIYPATNPGTKGSPDRPAVRATDRLPTKEPKTHVCVFCGKLYTRKYGLKIHLRTHTGHKPLHCRFCGRPFSDPSNLNKHIRLHAHHGTHVPSSPYKCRVCGKVMVRRRDLERHIKSRHEE